MFKTRVLQRAYNFSDHQVGFQIKDRLSCWRFLGLGMEDIIPDEKTVWANELSRASLHRFGTGQHAFGILARFDFATV